jgi:hypothetical protein
MPAEQAYREAVRDLGRLREALGENPEMMGDMQQLIREMQRLDPRQFPGNPQLLERMRTNVLPGLEQLALQLRRKLDDQQGVAARAGAPEPAPPGYADSVAEYFRKLSRER